MPQSTTQIPLRASRLLAVVFTLVLGASCAQSQSVVIEVNDTPSGDDDYLCWTPVRARARLLAASDSSAANATSKITLASENDAGGGAVQFQELQGMRPTRSTFAPAPSILLNLPADGSWQSFWVAGARPSSGAKDVRIVAKAENGASLGALPVMVRVRKDADTLTPFEVQVLLDALANLHDINGDPPNSAYTPLVEIHAGANEFHRSALFLPWHRAFVLDLERRLQAIDARVSIPYWRYDRKSTKIFSPDFMGESIPHTPTRFSARNHLARWIDPIRGALGRAPEMLPADGLPTFVGEDALIHPKGLFGTKYLYFRDPLEQGFHSGVHAGPNGVNGSLSGPRSPRDPLFFLLHANVDRVWAHWQAEHGRFDTSEEAYAFPGKFPGLGDLFGQSIGVYAEDGMWPWSDPAAATPPGFVSPWPPIVHPMPQGIHAPNPPVITPGGQIDYLDVNGKGLALGYCYDDIDFTGKVIATSP